MSRFAITDLPLAGLKLVERQRLGDSRGFLSRLFCAEELAAVGWVKPIAQINHTYTAMQGTVRGMHFQRPPHAEIKMVSCLKGEIWDVVVDIRRDSPTFLCWHGEVLSAANRKSLLIPEGCAHGFQALTKDCELIYLHTAPYHPEAECALNASDPRLEIVWPLPIGDLSYQDRTSPFIDQNFQGVLL